MGVEKLLLWSVATTFSKPKTANTNIHEEGPKIAPCETPLDERFL
jgi:hypothetical protein